MKRFDAKSYIGRDFEKEAWDIGMKIAHFWATKIDLKRVTMIVTAGSVKIMERRVFILFLYLQRMFCTLYNLFFAWVKLEEKLNKSLLNEMIYLFLKDFTSEQRPYESQQCSFEKIVYQW